MSEETRNFFKGKRPWSKIKDRVLGEYMSPYIAKVAKLGKPLLLIDAFAGPGKFEDGSPGSPLLMCKAAKKYAPHSYEAIFVNEEPEYHRMLQQLLKDGGWRDRATPILGDSRDFLKTVVPLLNSQSVFLYLDPFGLKDCDFSTLKPFLERSKSFSTEILINLSAPILHRLASREALQKGTGDENQIKGWHELLTRSLGGDYWKDALLGDNGLDTKSREQLVVDGYRRRLSSTNYLTYTGACPVQSSRDSRTKYYMIFASRHPDAMLLFNNIMCKAFNEYMHEEENQDTLFADLSWTTWRDTNRLKDIILNYVAKNPGKTREALWELIVSDNFMRFTDSEYKQAVTDLFNQNLIYSPTPRPTKRLNDTCELYIQQSRLI